MQNFLLDAMEFVITASVVTGWIGLVAVGVSILILYPSGWYKNKMIAAILPIILAATIGIASLTDYTNLREWGYFMPALALAPVFVSGLCYRKRIKEQGYHSTIR